MIERINEPKRVVCLKMKGRMTANDLKEHRALLQQHFSSDEKFSICIDLSELADMDGEAIALGAQADLELLQHLNQLDRLALVTDKHWPRVLVSAVARLFPTLEIKVFDKPEFLRACEWGSETDETNASPSPAFTFIPTKDESTLAFAIDGVVTAAEFPDIIDQFQRFFDHHDSARLLNRMTDFKGVEPDIFTQTGLIAMKLAALQKIERYAIVGAPR